MTLEEAWNLIELLNDDANQKSKNFWNSDISEAVRYQAVCFKENFLRLDKAQQNSIQYWIDNDDEFQDYFKCLSDYR